VSLNPHLNISCLFFLLFKLKDDYSGLCEQHSELEVKVKTSEMEIESQAKRCAQLENDIKGKVCINH